MIAQKQISATTQRSQVATKVASGLACPDCHAKEPFRSNSFVALSLRVRQSVLLAVGRFGLRNFPMASWQSALAAVRLRFPLWVGVRESNRLWLWLANNAVGSQAKPTCKQLAFCWARTFTLTMVATVVED
jgi:hypothetical protein